MEGKKYTLRFFPRLSTDMSEGEYSISVRLKEKFTNTVIQLAIKEQYKSSEGFYHLSKVYVKQPAIKTKGV